MFRKGKGLTEQRGSPQQGELFCQLYTWQRINSQNIKRTQKKKEPWKSVIELIDEL